jgi:hypothetical protein
MLDVNHYDARESAAKSRIFHHSYVTDNSPEAFEKFSLPTRVKELSQLQLYVESMQDGRYEMYQRMMGGRFSNRMLSRYISGLNRSLLCQRVYLNPRQQIVPFESMLAALVWSTFVEAMPTPPRGVIELGAGQGYGALFYSELSHLDRYVSIEITQAYYLLQHLMYKDAFESFDDLALTDSKIIESGERINSDGSRSSLQILSDWRVSSNVFINSTTRITHVPWWEQQSLPVLLGAGNPIDCIVANACLNEISLGALHRYLLGFRDLLLPGAKLFYGCPGRRHDDRNLPNILSRYDFVPLFRIKGSIDRYGYNFQFPLEIGAYEYMPNKLGTAANGLMLYQRDGSLIRNDEAAAWLDRVCELFVNGVTDKQPGVITQSEILNMLVSSG